MNLILIVGSGAVGKMTVGQELMKITDYRLFHNHMMIEPVIDIFGKFNGTVINKLRDIIFDEFIASDNVGMIFTYMWAFDMHSDWEYLKQLTDKFTSSGGTVYCVELVADQEVRLVRNKTENRLNNKVSKRDVDLSEGRLLREDSKYRLVSNDGEVPFENYIKIDNTHLEPDDVARTVKEYFHLPDKENPIYKAISLEPVEDFEVDILHKLQVESFMPLYEKYRDDDTSPAKESPDRLKAKVADPNRAFYFINYVGARVGAICVRTKEGEDASTYYISPIFVLPKYQNMGIGFIVIRKIFEAYSNAKKWKLDTILQEKGNCHLYEKCGFVRVGDEHVVNDRMTLIDYERVV